MNTNPVPVEQKERKLLFDETFIHQNRYKYNCHAHVTFGRMCGMEAGYQHADEKTIQS